ncbi:Dihydroorotate oxidase B, electron transfer subunit [Anaerohalosphaera lusitana]|uniref:Dihydroorotate oxidase B, electron transfer subunit n=1 Tax=Anaerohalosphaera lusitana TaxID=1936003 RepID=A0A1U9NNE5_9BACT|nr:sulfide/dihydroorotate dehydrogenase-like FAD/NAD-binding protein [Anaerohalosphaera lusitana]AQT69419.1 Dihydroorotate oxidase B, electron transfer subunit [Anaerohalosphaera lusitana]
MAHKIIKKQQLSENVFTVDVKAPLIAEARKPGQFVIVGLDAEIGERIPLTIAGADTEKGTIRLVWQRVGKTTAQMSELNIGDEMGYIAGPLGTPTHIEKFGKVVCVGGGIGNAPLLPIARALKDAGNEIVTVLGARTKNLLILEEDFASISDELIIVTDDGSCGRKALVTEPLEEICKQSPKPDLAMVIGPAIMMKFCSEVTRKYDVPTQVSLNTIMVDGTGMCGGCRVEVGGETKFVCVDGPEFDGHQVDFDQMMKRQAAYKDLEKKAYEQYQHKCRIGLDANNNK